MRFKLPSFTLTVRDLTDEELTANKRGLAEGRDYYAVDILARGHKRTLTLCIGSPVILTQGSEWNEAEAARSAISFATAPWCADDPTERAWMEDYGEELTNEAYCHRTLGKELRQ